MSVSHEFASETPPSPSHIREGLRWAPWVYDIDPVSCFARLTLIGFVWYGIWWAYDLVSIVCANPLVRMFFQLPLWVIAIAFVWLYTKVRGHIRFTNIYGSARYARESELRAAEMLGRRGVILGRFKEPSYRLKTGMIRLLTRPLNESDRIIRYVLTAATRETIELHRPIDGEIICVPERSYTTLATFAPTGKGKGVGVVIPQLLNYPHSIMCIDIKGENYKLTAARRKAMGQRVIVLDPFGITDEVSASINPLDLIDPHSRQVIDDVKFLCEALVVRSDKEADPYWSDQSILMLQALTLFVLCCGKPEDRHLSSVRSILSDPEQLEDAWKYMKASPALEGILAQYGATFSAVPPIEYGSIVSSACKHSEFLASLVVRPHVESTSFDIRSIASRPTTIYLILPAQYVRSHFRLMRMWLNTLLLVVKMNGASEEHEILFLLDEIAQLQELGPIEEAITLLRGFGMRTWLIYQSIGQLHTNFPGERSKTILANCDIQQFFGISDYETAEYVSKMIGKQTVVAPSVNAGSSSNYNGGQHSSTSQGHSQGTTHASVQTDLIRPEEIMRDSSVFLFKQGFYPIKATRLTYYSDPAFASDTGTVRRRVSTVSSMIAALGIALSLSYLYSYVTSITFTRASNAISPEVSSVPESASASRRAMPPLTLPPADLILICPKCANQATVPATLAGTTLQCDQCQNFVLVPYTEAENRP